MRDDEVFELSEDDLPLTIHVIDKDGVEVDTIVIEDAGVMELPVYPPEGRPYTVRLEPADNPRRNLVERAYLHPGWAEVTGGLH